MNEKLSALMDNELNELETRQLLRALEHDNAMRDTWDRYHTIRAALRGESLLQEADIAGRVRQRLADESTPTKNQLPLMRLAGQLALAASVAAVAILGAQWWLGAEQDVSSTVARQEAMPVEYLRASATRWDVQERDAESRLNAYLVEHSEFAPAAGINGMLPYVRVVGYDSGNGRNRIMQEANTDRAGNPAQENRQK